MTPLGTRLVAVEESGRSRGAELIRSRQRWAEADHPRDDQGRFTAVRAFAKRHRRKLLTAALVVGGAALAGGVLRSRRGGAGAVGAHRTPSPPPVPGSTSIKAARNVDDTPDIVARPARPAASTSSVKAGPSLRSGAGERGKGGSVRARSSTTGSPRTSTPRVTAKGSGEKRGRKKTPANAAFDRETANTKYLDWQDRYLDTGNTPRRLRGRSLRVYKSPLGRKTSTKVRLTNMRALRRARGDNPVGLGERIADDYHRAVKARIAKGKRVPLSPGERKLTDREATLWREIRRSGGSKGRNLRKGKMQPDGTTLWEAALPHYARQLGPGARAKLKTYAVQGNWMPYGGKPKPKAKEEPTKTKSYPTPVQKVGPGGYARAYESAPVDLETAYRDFEILEFGWNESLHPRDNQGRFSGVGGAARRLGGAMWKSPTAEQHVIRKLIGKKRTARADAFGRRHRKLRAVMRAGRVATRIGMTPASWAVDVASNMYVNSRKKTLGVREAVSWNESLHPRDAMGKFAARGIGRLDRFAMRNSDVSKSALGTGIGWGIGGGLLFGAPVGAAAGAGMLYGTGRALRARSSDKKRKQSKRRARWLSAAGKALTVGGTVALAAAILKGARRSPFQSLTNGGFPEVAKINGGIRGQTPHRVRTRPAPTHTMRVRGPAGRRSFVMTKTTPAWNRQSFNEWANTPGASLEF